MKTLNLIDSHLKRINEQADEDDRERRERVNRSREDEHERADATDLDEQPEPETPVPLTAEGEKYLIGLLVRAFLHTPDESEGKIVKELQAMSLDVNPKGVAEAIENMLELSPTKTEDILDLTTDINI